MEKNEFEENDSLRSPTYIYNLFEKLGNKKCAFCGCEIPQLVEGAHIWSVSDIKRETRLSFNVMLKYATDGDNGLWLCVNHHRMLDMNLLRISENRRLKFKSNIEDKSIAYIKGMTSTIEIEDTIFTDKFSAFLERRNKLVHDVSYSYFN
jgi:predicted restriction endonuclease